MSNVSNYTEYGQLGTMDTEKIANLKTAAEGGGGGGGDIFVVNLTPDNPTSTTKYTADVSTADIGEAMLNGTLVVAKLQIVNDSLHVTTQTNFVDFLGGVYSTTLNQTYVYAPVMSGDTYDWQIGS